MQSFEIDESNYREKKLPKMALKNYIKFHALSTNFNESII